MESFLRNIERNPTPEMDDPREGKLYASRVCSKMGLGGGHFLGDGSESLGACLAHNPNTPIGPLMQLENPPGIIQPRSTTTLPPTTLNLVEPDS